MQWSAYKALLLVRLALLLAPGYVHPDEMFQGPEVAAADVFDLPHAVRPWEFPRPCNATSQPSRSVLAPPYAVSRLAFAALAWLQARGAVLPVWLLLAAPRLGAMLFTLAAGDTSVQYLATGAVGGAASAELLCWAGCWPVLVLGGRPFSNSYEASLFGLGAALAARARRQRAAGARGAAALAAVAFGLVAGMAIVTRFTAVLLFAPLALLAFAQGQGACLALAGGAGAAVLACAAALDRAYFGCARAADALAPLNNARYNGDATHLARHGLHPRATHALVNLPLLFAPLAAAAAVAVVRGRRLAAERWGVAAIGIGYLAALSLAPHQEPRFLLPLALPLVLVGARDLCTSRVAVWLLALHTLAGVLLFAGLHQAGLVRLMPLLAAAAAADAAATADGGALVLAAHCYMLPRFLLAQVPRLAVVDLGSVGAHALCAELLARRPQMLVLATCHVDALAAACPLVRLHALGAAALQFNAEDGCWWLGAWRLAHDRGR